MSISTKVMIRWKLREVMARGKVTNRELALRTGHHETSISRLKMTDEMPRIDGETLNVLCLALTQIFRDKNLGDLISPADLIEFTFNGDENPPKGIEGKTSQEVLPAQSNKEKGDSSRSTHLRVIPEVA